MANTHARRLARLRRKKHIKKTVRGTTARPRLSVFRSSKHIYAQIIDDETGATVAAASSLGVKSGGTREGAAAVGKKIGELAKAANIDLVVFDRNGFLYHGRVASLADAAREAGLDF